MYKIICEMESIFEMDMLMMESDIEYSYTLDDDREGYLFDKEKEYFKAINLIDSKGLAFSTEDPHEGTN